jgi:hypothetical protein
LCAKIVSTFILKKCGWWLKGVRDVDTGKRVPIGITIKNRCGKQIGKRHKNNENTCDYEYQKCKSSVITRVYLVGRAEPVSGQGGARLIGNKNAGWLLTDCEYEKNKCSHV